MRKTVALMIAVLAPWLGALPARAADEEKADKAPQKPEKGEKPRPAASTPPPAPALPPKPEVQRLVTDFDSQRQSLLNEHRAAMDRLRAAKTEDERRRVLTEIRELQRERMKEQRELVRQRRDDMAPAMRPAPPPGKSGG